MNDVFTVFGRGPSPPKRKRSRVKKRKPLISSLIPIRHAIFWDGRKSIVMWNTRKE